MLLRSKSTSLLKDPFASISVLALVPPTPTTSNDEDVSEMPSTELLLLPLSASTADARIAFPPLTSASTTCPVASSSKSSRRIPKSSITDVDELVCSVLLASELRSALTAPET